MKLFAIIALLISSACFAQANQPPKSKFDPRKFSDQAAQQTIEKGVQYLLSRQKADGSWEPFASKSDFENNPIGPSCMALYALLEKGMSVSDPNIAKGLDFITKDMGKDSDTDKIYSIAFRCQALLLASKQDKKYLKYLDADVKQLLGSINSDGSYAYYTLVNKKAHDERKGTGDNSNSQYGVLGVWAGARANIEIPKEYWNSILKYWLGQQRNDNGWCYRTSGGYVAGSDDITTATMTSAGIATLFVCLDAVLGDKFIKCDANNDFAAIKKGLEWFDKNFDQTLTNDAIRGKKGIADLYYFLYGVERIGLASGYKFFGGIDWYKYGSTWLIENQQANGSWIPRCIASPDVITSYAILFLVRGQRPVLFNRLQYDGDWNNRPRALANFVRWSEKAFETESNWQIVTIKSSVDEWHDAPILCITGSKAPQFSNEELAKLRTFAYQGGTILSISECGGLAFSKGMQETYRKLFPRYELSTCGKEHPIYSIQNKLPNEIQFSEIHNGIRPLAIHTNSDLPLTWQMYQVATGKSSFEAAANVILYVTDKQFKNRGVGMWPAEQESASPVKKTATIARIRYSGNYDPEPLAMEKFARLMAQKYSVKVELQEQKKISSTATAVASQPASEIIATGVAIADLKPGLTLAIMSGTGKFTLTAAEKESLKKYADSGGLILFESAGGSAGFFESAKDLIGELWGQDKLLQMPLDNQIYRLEGMTIEKVQYRRMTMKRTGPTKEPRLMAVVNGNKPIAILSREDLSGGLVGYSSYGCDGYDPESAFQIMRNIVIYSLDTAPSSRTTTSLPFNAK